jgi:arylformamidase
LHGRDAACDDRLGLVGDRGAAMGFENLKLIDVTLPFSDAFPVWPGDPAIELRPLERIENGGSSNVTQIVCPTHSGTHVDPPRHFIAGGATISDLPLERWVGPCQVIAVDESVTAIEPSDLLAAGIAPGVERLLLKTRNSQKWNRASHKFDTDYAALTTDSARWLVERGVKLVGIDYLSIELFDGDGETHRTLLGNDVLAIEGLDLRAVLPGDYLLICLPLKLENGDGAQARVVLATT